MKNKMKYNYNDLAKRLMEAEKRWLQKKPSRPDALETAIKLLKEESEKNKKSEQVEHIDNTISVLEEMLKELV